MLGRKQPVVRVAIEAVACFLVVGLLLFEFGDDGSKSLHSADPAFITKAASWMSKAQLVALTTVVPSACGAANTNSITGLTNVCAYLNMNASNTGCCSASTFGSSFTQTLNTFDANCADLNCKLNFLNFWCTFSCRKSGEVPCQADLSALSMACAYSCPNLVTLGYVANVSTDGSALAAWTTAAYQQNATRNCTAVMAQQGDNAAPTILSVGTGTIANPVNFTFDISSSSPVSISWFTAVTSPGTVPDAYLQLAVNGLVYYKARFPTSGWVYTQSNSWTNSMTTSWSSAIAIPVGTTVATVFAVNTVSNVSMAQSGNLIITSSGASIGQINPCANGGSGVAYIPSTATSSSGVQCSCNCNIQAQSTDANPSLTVSATTQTSSAMTFAGQPNSLLTIVNNNGFFPSLTTAQSMSLPNSQFVLNSGPFTIGQNSYTFNAPSSCAACGVVFSIRSTPVIAAGAALNLGASLFNFAPLALQGTIGVNQGGKLSVLNSTSVVTCTNGGQLALNQGNFDTTGGQVSGCSAVLTAGQMWLSGSTYDSSVSTVASNGNRRFAGSTNPINAVICATRGPRNTNTFNRNGQLVIQTACMYQAEQGLTNTATPATTLLLSGRSQIGATIIMQTGSVLTFDTITPTSRPYDIQQGGLSIVNGAIVEAIFLNNGVWPVGGQDVALLRFPTANNPYCAQNIFTLGTGVTTTIESCPQGRTCSLLFKPESATICLFVVRVSPSTNVSTVYSDTVYLNLARDCATYDELAFVTTVTTLLGLNSNEVVVTGKYCASMTVLFRCPVLVPSPSATDIAAANAKCQAIRTNANTPGTPLNLALLIAIPQTHSDDGTSNNAIFALFTLIALPIFCVVGFIMWYRSKQTEADNQYLQDTHTFSSVAAHGVPYDPIKPYVYPVQPVPVAYGYAQ